MHLFHHTYTDPKKNIDVDKFLLEQVNLGYYPAGIMRLWESSTYFVVLGLSKKIIDDVHEQNCINDGIPILKRCSGGGTVLQGPGCFNYSYILPIGLNDQLSSLNQTTTYILNLVKDTLSSKVSGITLSGISDLAINKVKFSGNAQRRLKHAILFHGTILYNFKLPLINDYLKEPPIQPDYREQRTHQEFVRNILISSDELISLFTKQITSSEIDIKF